MNCQPPDRETLVIRSVCGAVFGFFAAFLSAARLHPHGPWWVWVLAAIVFALLFAWSAAKYGDEFWEDLLARWR